MLHLLLLSRSQEGFGLNTKRWHISPLVKQQRHAWPVPTYASELYLWFDSFSPSPKSWLCCLRKPTGCKNEDFLQYWQNYYVYPQFRIWACKCISGLVNVLPRNRNKLAIFPPTTYCVCVCGKGIYSQFHLLFKIALEFL